MQKGPEKLSLTVTKRCNKSDKLPTEAPKSNKSLGGLGTKRKQAKDAH